VLTSGTEETLGLDRSIPGLTVERIHTGRRRADLCTPFEMLRYVISAARHLPTVRTRFKPDVVHCFFGMPTGAALYLDGLARNKPYLVTLLGGDVPGFLPSETALIHRATSFASRAVWKQAAFVLPNSKGLAELARNTLDRRYDVVTNGVSLQQFVDTGAISSAGPLRLLFVGRLVRQKGLDILIEALRKVVSPELLLTIVGDGPDRSQLEAQTVGWGGEQIQFSWRGWVPLDELPELYRAHHALIMPSRFEGMASVMLQAMSCGCTVVTTDVFGAADVVTDSVCGYVVPVEDVDALADRISRLTPDALSRLRAAARLRATEYSWERIVERIEALYSEAIRLS
jgi:glycosyltransferase involved in cell wall biosynthesis